jgi:hypothetical protein
VLAEAAGVNRAGFLGQARQRAKGRSRMVRGIGWRAGGRAVSWCSRVAINRCDDGGRNERTVEGQQAGQ